MSNWSLSSLIFAKKSTEAYFQLADGLHTFSAHGNAFRSKLKFRRLTHRFIIITYISSNAKSNVRNTAENNLRTNRIALLIHPASPRCALQPFFRSLCSWKFKPLGPYGAYTNLVQDWYQRILWKFGGVVYPEFEWESLESLRPHGAWVASTFRIIKELILKEKKL